MRSFSRLVSSIISVVMLSAFVFGAMPVTVLAKDVYVDGYYRKDGTYVRPHVRSAPDRSRANNYGPSRSNSELLNPRSRDNDRDGTPNYRDYDDNNNGISDNRDRNQYGRGFSGIR